MPVISMNGKKAELRKQILKARNALLPEQRQLWDQKILQHLIEYDKKSPCPVYLCYVSYKSEVSTKEFICWCLKNGKKVFVPKVLKDQYPEAGGKFSFYKKTEETLPEMKFYQIIAWEELKKGYQGILEPEALPERAFGEHLKKSNFCFRLLLPGAVFDKAGNRIGYGGGFYDRWLAKWNDFQCGSTERFAKGADFGYSPVRMLEKIGLAYQMQIVDEIPVENFDQKIDLVITEEYATEGIREESNDT